MSSHTSNVTMNRQDESSKGNQVTALARGLDVLRCFSAARPHLGTAAISRLTNIPQPTVWRLCQTLLKYGFLLQVPGSSNLQLGTSALAIGIAAGATFDALEHVYPKMQQIANTFQTAVSIASREGLDMVYLRRYAAEALVSTNLRVGSRLAAHKCTLGWAIMAAMPEAERRAFIHSLSGAYPHDADRLQQQAADMVRQYKETGYVVAKGLVHTHIIALAMPICNSDGPQMAINCSSDINGMSADTLRAEIAPALKDMAQMLEVELFSQGKGAPGNLMARLG